MRNLPTMAGKLPAFFVEDYQGIRAFFKISTKSFLLVITLSLKTLGLLFCLLCNNLDAFILQRLPK
jgi:hypothetical protein